MINNYSKCKLKQVDLRPYKYSVWIHYAALKKIDMICYVICKWQSSGEKRDGSIIIYTILFIRVWFE